MIDQPRDSSGQKCSSAMVKLGLAALLATLAAAGCDGDGGPGGGGGGGGAGGTGGPSEEPAESPVSGPTCPDLKTCEGSLVGTWDGEATCTTGLFSHLVARCGSFTENTVEGNLKLRYTFTESTMTRVMSGTIKENIDIPLSCAGGLTTCDEVQGDIVRALYGEFSNPRPDSEDFAATCTAAAADTCNCDVEYTVLGAAADTTSGYQLESATAFTAASDEELYQFCVDGDTLQISTYIIDLNGIFPHSAVYTLKKQ